MSEPVGVIGAGTMGTGIAQVAAEAGHPVWIFDTAPGAAERAAAVIRERVAARAAKGRVDVDPMKLSLQAAVTLAELAGARLVIEAVAEDLKAKQRLFADLEQFVAPDAVLASNTSSLSPTAIAAGLAYPERVVGLHFFNPVPVMRLVELVPGLATTEPVVTRASALAASWGKTVVRAGATPGFIVNRVARPFYAEALRLYEEHAADPPTIDAVLTGAGGFRMGPFTLTDLIGQDVNEAVTRSVWAAFEYDPWFAPSLAQRALVEAGLLGRKSGRGFYDYSDGPQPSAAIPAEDCSAPVEVAEYGTSQLSRLLTRSGVRVRQDDRDGDWVQMPSGALLARSTGTTATALAVAANAPVVVVDRALDDDAATAIAVAASDGCPHKALSEATGLLQAAGLAVFVVGDVPGLIVARTVAMLVNLASDALHRGVASAADIDTAMRLGTNYPIGPLEWGHRWGLPVVQGILDALLRAEGDPRYRTSTLLRRRAISGGMLV